MKNSTTKCIFSNKEKGQRPNWSRVPSSTRWTKTFHFLVMSKIIWIIGTNLSMEETRTSSTSETRCFPVIIVLRASTRFSRPMTYTLWTQSQMSSSLRTNMANLPLMTLFLNLVTLSMRISSIESSTKWSPRSLEILGTYQRISRLLRLETKRLEML